MASKKALFEKFTHDLNRIWKTAPRGLILWNLCIVAILIVPAFCNIELFIFAQVIGSFFAFAIMLDNDLSGSSSHRNLWTLATAFALFCGLMMIAFGILQFAYRWTFKMKKILNLLVYRPNRWYDNIKEPFRFLFFMAIVVIPFAISQFLSVMYGIWQPFVIITILVFTWRILYLTRKKKTYVFDIETQGLHNTSFDYVFMVEREKKKSTVKPEIIDVFTLSEKINKK